MRNKIPLATVRRLAELRASRPSRVVAICIHMLGRARYDSFHEPALRAVAAYFGYRIEKIS